MKISKIKTFQELFDIVEREGGSLVFTDEQNQPWILERLTRTNSNMTVSQTCTHQWMKREYEEQHNHYLERECSKCHLVQRWLSSIGEWSNIRINGKDV